VFTLIYSQTLILANNQCVTHLNNPDVTLVGALGDLDGLADELPVAAHIGTATAAPPATAAAESTA
jgi:hypothetical protein